MSKRVRLVLSICVLTLCLCTMTFGVLAAFEKTNHIKGEIGFNAENCDVTVFASISGAVKEDGSANNAILSRQTVTNQLTWDIKDPLCFNEKNYPNIPDIVITFVIINNSPVAALRIKASVGDAIPSTNFTAKFASTVGTWSDKDGILLGKKGDKEEVSTTITLTIKLKDKETTFRADPHKKQLVNFLFEAPKGN